MSRTSTFIVVALLGAAFAAFWVLNPLCPEFKVHTEGIVLITGTSSGIGRDFALHLAKTTKFTVYAGVRKEADAESLKAEGLENIKPVILDVTKSEHITQVVDTIKSSKQPLVGLVNNAGISASMVWEGLDLEMTRKVYDINVFGVYELTKECLPLLRQSQGRIINVGSMAAVGITEGRSVYSATKAALRAMTTALRREVQNLGVSVSVVEPGYVVTPIATKPIRTADKNLVSDQVYQTYKTWFDTYRQKRQGHFEKYADTTEVTTNALMAALVDVKPQTRYAVAHVDLGLPSWAMEALMWLASDRVEDFILNQAV